MKLFLSILFISVSHFIFANNDSIKVMTLELPMYRFHAHSKAISLTPGFTMQYANKDFYNSSITLLPGFEYFFFRNLSAGIILGPEFHLRQSASQYHYHVGSNEELFARKYFLIDKKRNNKTLYISAGVNHLIRWNHYHVATTDSHTMDIESHLRLFTDIGLAYSITKQFVLSGAVRINYRYDATNNGRSFNLPPDVEANYNVAVKYFLN